MIYTIMSLSKNKTKVEKEEERIDKELRHGCAYCGSICADGCYWCIEQDERDYDYCNCAMCQPYSSDYWYDWYMNSPERVREQKLDELIGEDKVQRVGDFLPDELKVKTLSTFSIYF
jgi:hypothetical protein